MAFNYFRILVTLLASLGAFFAYTCRLNLSLIIDDMVVQEELAPIKIGEKYQQDIMPVGFPDTEEHTYAWTHQSANKYRNWDRMQSKARKKGSERASHKVVFGPEGATSLLSIEFDVDPNKSSDDKRNQSSYHQQGNQSTEVTNREVSEDRLQDVKRQENLLNWSQVDRNDLLGAFFLGYVIFQIPAARGAEMFGAKSLFLITGFGASLCSLAFPFAAKFSTTSIVFPYAIRVIMGATQSALFPAAYVLLCEWLPPSERSRWLPCPSAFSRIGAIVMNFTLPLVVLNYGWEMAFYASGSVTLIWCLLFTVIGSNSPSESYWISKQELMHIESHIEPRVGTRGKPPASITASGFSINESANESTKRPSISWPKIITNRPIIILTIVMLSSEWSNMLLLVKLPGFLRPVFGMDSIEYGLWNSYLIAVFCIHFPFSGFLASRLEGTKMKGFTSLRVRKIFETSAHAMQGAGCLIIAFSDSKPIVLSALFLMMIGRSTVGGGQCLMPPELSRDYPGTVFAFANTIANLAGIIGPMTVSWLVEKPKEHDSWFSLWILSASIFFICGLIFCLFAENKPQNFSRKPKRGKGRSGSVSQAQLTLDKNPEQIFKMDAFSRVANEPKPKLDSALRHIPISVGQPQSQRMQASRFD